MGTRSPEVEVVTSLGVAEAGSDALAIRSSVDDPELFVAVFDRHFDAVHRYLHRRLGRDFADELSAEVFAVALRRRSGFDPKAESALPWLYGIAANLVRRHRRTEVRRLRAYARTGIDDCIELDEVRLAERADARRLGPTLAAALASLGVEDRETLSLVVFADLTYEEVGRALGVPAGTVASRMSRIRRRLSSRLAESPSVQEAS